MEEKLFIKISIGFFEHYKIECLSDSAIIALQKMIIRSWRMASDGRLHQRTVMSICGSQDVIDELMTNDDRNPSLTLDPEGYYLIHGFTDYQTTRADMEMRHSKRVEAGRKGAEARWAKPEKSSRSTSLPGDWKPQVGHEQFCVDNGLDCKIQAERFRLHAEMNDRKMKDWNAAFRMWLSKAAEWAPKNKPVQEESVEDLIARLKEENNV